MYNASNIGSKTPIKHNNNHNIRKISVHEYDTVLKITFQFCSNTENVQFVSVAENTGYTENNGTNKMTEMWVP